MGKSREVEGTYGSGKTPSTIFVYDNSDGSSWYIAKGGSTVNKTYDHIEDGVDIEELSDDDVFTANEPINSLSDLEAFMKDEEYSLGGVLLGAGLGVAGIIGYNKLKDDGVKSDNSYEHRVKEHQANIQARQAKLRETPLPYKVRFYNIIQEGSDSADVVYEKFLDSKWKKINKQEFDDLTGMETAWLNQDYLYERKSRSEPMKGKDLKGKNLYDNKSFVWYLKKNKMEQGGTMATGGSVEPDFWSSYSSEGALITGGSYISSMDCGGYMQKGGEAGKPKYDIGEQVLYIPKLSGLDNKKPLIVENRVYSEGDDFTSKGYYYTFENSSLRSSESDLKSVN